MKLDVNTYHEIADSLLRNKSRSLLTGFGIFWGLFMLLVMLGAGDLDNLVPQITKLLKSKIK